MGRFRKIAVATAVALLLLAIIWWTGACYGPERNVNAYKKWLVSRGEKLNVSWILSPSVPTEKNGATIINKAAAMLSPGGDDWTNLPSITGQMIGTNKAIVCFKQPDVFTYFDVRNSWSNMMAIAEADRPALELLGQLTTCQANDFQLDHSQSWEQLSPQFEPLTRCMKRLWAGAICDLHAGDTPSATTNICPLLAIVNGDRDERIETSLMVLLPVAHLAASANWELLQSSNVNDAELAVLQKSWERLELIPAMENAVLMERAAREIMINKVRTSPHDFDQLVGSQEDWSFSDDWSDDRDKLWNNMKDIYGKAMWRSSWTYSDELLMLKNYQSILETIRAIETNGVFNPAYPNLMNQLSATEVTIENDNLADFRWPFSKDASTASNLGALMVDEAARRIVIAAIILKRYQLKHGNYPATLSALAPEFVSSVLLDPVTGKPLRYRRNIDGTFLLYSVGINGKDDGGSAWDPASPAQTYWLNLNALDWVWPIPATAREIQEFQSHPVVSE